MIKQAHRLERLPPYLFREIDSQKQEAIKNGVDLVDLGIGDPDLPTPQPIIEALYKAANNPKNHRYPSQTGIEEFKKTACDWMRKRFNVELDYNSEIITLIGTKEGIAHLPLAVINYGDIGLIPDPGYPVYRSGIIFAGGEPYEMPLIQENHFLPNLDIIPKEVYDKAKLMFINYPNNPTSATANKEFFAKVIDFAKKYDFLVCHDISYSEVSFDGYKAPSILEIEGAKDVAIEMHSLSKTYNMTGWRIGFAVGNKEAIRALATLKNNLDSGVFNAIQFAGITALNLPATYLQKNMGIISERRKILCEGLESVGLEFIQSKATFYVWVKVPQGYDSMGFCSFLLKELGVIATPGIGFGKSGKGYIRFSLTTPTERIREAVKRLGSKL